jgi:endonuclease YncB( thermonuclease family)
MTFPLLALPRRGGVLLLTAAAFGLGLMAGAGIAPVAALRGGETAAQAVPAAAPAGLRTGYPAQVLRVIDGDTFEARVRIWPGLDVTTKVRLSDVDAPELRARCSEERVKAQAARDALAALLAEGEVGIAQVTLDKYGGRVDAVASTRRTADVSAALVGGGFARLYQGGRRAGWC